MPWYAGPTIVSALCALSPVRRIDGAQFRLAVQGVIRRDLERIVVGRIEAGTLRVGDEIVLSPGDRRARVRSLESWPPSGRTEARAGESIGFTIEGPLFVERGDVVSDTGSVPVAASRFRARLLWLGKSELRVGMRLRMRLGTRLAHVEVEAFERVVDIATLQGGDAHVARTNDIAEIVLRSRELLALDTVGAHAGLGRFVLIDGLDVAAGGVVLAALSQGSDVVPVGHLLDRDARAWRNGHRGAVLWLTGLPAAGKSTLAMQLERRLFERGVQTYVLDGDNIRTGLCRDLGFTADDRSENVRRVGEVAALFADAGLVAIAAFISPYRADREEARRAAGSDFHEIYVKAAPALCEARDPKGHYAKARAGGLPGFTGLSGDYEEPLAADLVVDTAALSIEGAVALVLDYITQKIDVERDRAVSI